MTGGFVIAAPASGCGKTIITLALLRALRRAGHRPASLKIGPDYIDPGFHRTASGGDCRNYDPWAMRPHTLDNQVDHVAQASDIIVAEGVTGLFDGAADGTASTAHAAARLGWPVILVVDVRGQGASVAAVVEGFARHRDDTRIAGVILNRVGSDRHREILERALSPTGIPIFGMVPRHDALALPDRHLGLVQAREQPALDEQIDRAAAIVETEIHMAGLLDLAAPATPMATQGTATRGTAPPVPPPGQHVAVARDEAFSFAYPHVLAGWRNAGAEISRFSPLADEAPHPAASAIYLPGGYPELHAGRLAANRAFLDGLRRAAGDRVTLYGECGGFMVLGDSLTDRDGADHRMAGLLPVRTSFAEPRLHLGYRRMALCADGFLGKKGARFCGHEFHYSVQISPQPDTPLFEVSDATGKSLGPVGCQQGTIMGAYCHLIDRAD